MSAGGSCPEGLEVSHVRTLATSKKSSGTRGPLLAIFVMGLPEDKVSLLDDDNQETPPPTFVDENEFEDRSSVCRVLCVSLTYVVVLGVFLTSFAYHSSSSDEDSHGYMKGLFISRYSFFRFRFMRIHTVIFGVCIEEVCLLILAYFHIS